MILELILTTFNIIILLLLWHWRYVLDKYRKQLDDYRSGLNAYQHLLDGRLDLLIMGESPAPLGEAEKVTLQ